MVQTRPKLTLGEAHVTQPFYSTFDVIDTLTNQVLTLLYSRPISTLHTLTNDYLVRRHAHEELDTASY